MFKIVYYEHTANHYSSFQSNIGEIHLTQSAGFSEFLKSKSNNHNNIFGYKSFVTNLFSEWYHPHTEVYLLSKVREFLKKQVAYENWNYYESLVREYYLSFVFLVEMGGVKLVSNEELSLTKEQKLLNLLVSELMNDEHVLNYFRNRAQVTKQSLSNLIESKEPIERIYFHHFDYIDAGRMMLINLFDQIGIEVNMVIPYNSRFPELYKTWESIYQSFPVPRNSWQQVNNGIPEKGLKFAAYIDKNSIDASIDTREIHFDSYSHPVEFKEYLTNNPIIHNKEEIIAIFDENLNRYTSQTTNDSFYSMKYGQFLLSLQNCKKTENDIRFTYDDYVNMMTSGWVHSGNISGEKGLSLLIDLRSYFDEVETFPDLMDRLQSLIEFQEMGQVFDDIAKEQTGRNRLKRYLSNPFRTFPQMRKSRYSITIRQLMECTKDLARKLNKLLVEQDEKRNVKEYLLNLQEIYQGVSIDWDPIAKAKFENLFIVSLPDDWTFASDELHQLLAIYLGKQTMNKDVISNFDQLTGKTLFAENIHVTGLSFQTFPWKTPDMPSLLTHSWLKKSIYSNYISHNRERRLNALVVDYYSRKVTRNTALYSLYHLLAYNNGIVTLSYIEGLLEKDGPSIYLTVLKELYELTETQEKTRQNNELDWDEPDFSSNRDIDLEIFKKIPDLMWLDSDFCKKKFFLNSIIEHHPVYEQDFHQQQAFATIGKLMSEQGDGPNEVKQTIYPLFPQWTNALKDNLVETSSANGLREYKSYENIYYPKALRKVQTLFSRYEVTKNWKARDQYRKDTFKIDKHVQELNEYMKTYEIEAESGHHCRMCPFLTICKEGEFAIDAND